MNKLKIDAKIFDELHKIKRELPSMSPGGEYSNPAGMALLGAKDNLIDEVIYIKGTSGCDDVPGVSYGNVDKGLRKMLKLGKVVSGMALIRNTGLDEDCSTYFSSQMKQNVREMKNSFPDITKTLWIAFGNNVFKTYGVKKDKVGRLFVNEIKTKTIIHVGDAENKVYKSIRYDEIQKEKRIAAGKKAAKIAKEKREKEIKEGEKAAKEEKENRFKEMKDKKKEIIDLGNGYHFRLTRDGKYILWR